MTVAPLNKRALKKEACTAIVGSSRAEISVQRKEGAASGLARWDRAEQQGMAYGMATSVGLNRHFASCSSFTSHSIPFSLRHSSLSSFIGLILSSLPLAVTVLSLVSACFMIKGACGWSFASMASCPYFQLRSDHSAPVQYSRYPAFLLIPRSFNSDSLH